MDKPKGRTTANKNKAVMTSLPIRVEPTDLSYMILPILLLILLIEIVC